MDALANSLLGDAEALSSYGDGHTLVVSGVLYGRPPSYPVASRTAYRSVEMSASVPTPNRGSGGR